MARHHRGDAQRQALLAEQCIATITGAVRPDLVGLREVHDILAADDGLARPGRVRPVGRKRRANRMHAWDERAVAEHVEHGAPHAGHDPGVDHDVGTVGDLHADLRDRRAEWPHAERNHIHGAAAHAAVEQAQQRLAHLVRRRPVVGGAGVILAERADEGPLLDPRDVGRVRAREIGVRAFLGIEADERAGLDHLRAQPVVFLDRAVDPVDAVRLAKPPHPADPGQQTPVGHADRYGHILIQCQSPLRMRAPIIVAQSTRSRADDDRRW